MIGLVGGGHEHMITDGWNRMECTSHWKGEEVSREGGGKGRLHVCGWVQCQHAGSAVLYALGERVTLYADRLECAHPLTGFLRHAVLLFLLQGAAAH